MDQRILDHLQTIRASLDQHIESANNVAELVAELMRPGPSRSVVLSELKELADDLAATIGQLDHAAGLVPQPAPPPPPAKGEDTSRPDVDRTIQSRPAKGAKAARPKEEVQ